MVKVYKLVAEENGKLLSYGVLPPLEVEYTPGKIVYGSNLFAFDTLEHAQEYNPAGSIWEAETSSIEPAGPMILAAGSLDLFDAYWSGEHIDKHYLIETPTGTVHCDDLKLIRKVN